MALREASISVVRFKVFALARSALVISILAPIAAASLTAQQIDQASVIRGIDAAVRARVNSIAGYAVTEHYAVTAAKTKPIQSPT